MNVGKMKILCLKTFLKVISFVALFSVLASFISEEQYQHSNRILNATGLHQPIERFMHNASQSAIPHIIHQAWDDSNVPNEVHRWTKSWLEVHPKWQHWFWIEKGSRQLIGQKHRNYLSLYDQYPYMINRADVRRYFIMYEYGGIYADLDVESLKPLDGLLQKYQCIIAQEPEEHQTLLYHNQAPNFAMPAFMACRPHHPFFKLLIDKLADYIGLAWNLPWNENIIKSTGPMFVGAVLDLYVKLYNDTPETSVHLAPASWFMPTFDVMNTNAFLHQCSNDSMLQAKQHNVCLHLHKRNYTNVPGPDAFTNHHWLHAWGSDFRSKGSMPVDSLIPDVKLIHHILPHIT